MARITVCDPLLRLTDPLQRLYNSALRSCSHFKHEATKETLWLSFLCNSSWTADEIIRRGFLHTQHEHSNECTSLVSALRKCAKVKDLSSGTTLHDDILRRGFLHKCSDALVTMYARCGALDKAKEVFNRCRIRNVFTWTSLIAGFVEKGQAGDALVYYERMLHEGISPIAVTFTCILKACCSIGAVDKGERIHDEIAKQGLLQINPILGNALVNMYAKCGALIKAKQVLEDLPARNVNTWCALITSYAHEGKGEEALSCFERMQHEGLSPDPITFTCILKACGSIGAINKGEQIHNEILEQNVLENDVELGTALVDMYAKCGALEKARKVLKELPNRNVISWSALIAGYAQHGQGQEAMSCFEDMQCDGFSPDAVTFTCILKACSSIGATDEGERIHDDVSKLRLLENNFVLGNALVDMYAKCGAFSKAWQIILELRNCDIISWNALIGGYSQHGNDEQALACFTQMHREGHLPNAVTFHCILKACSNIGALEEGELIHDEIIRRGLLEKDPLLGNALFEMYTKCGALAKARRLLGELLPWDSVSWTAIIAGYVQLGECEEALKCFEQMQLEGLSPDEATLLCIVNVCGTIKAADRGKKIHDEIAKGGLLGKSIALGNALVDMYAKCGVLAKAQEVLDELPTRDVVSWNALITGYAQEGELEQAMKCLHRMKGDSLSPNAVTFTCILKACSTVGAVDKGEQVHEEIARHGFLGSDIILGTALVDMYAKCGALVKAKNVLEQLPMRSVITWNALIAGTIQKGDCEQALNYLKQMQHEGLSPNAATFSCMLSACSRLGLLKDAQLFFSSMSTTYAIIPDLEHCACIIDLLGRVGHLDEAVSVMEKLPSSYSGPWSVLLDACQKWGNVNVGRWAFEHAIEVDKCSAALYVSMANIYAAAGMKKEAKGIDSMRIEHEEAWQRRDSRQFAD